MSDRPIPPVDPIVRTPRVMGGLRHVEAADAFSVDAALQGAWKDALARELLKAKAEAERRSDGGAMRRWRELARSLWPSRREDEDGSAEGRSPQQAAKKRDPER
jgi:hypothetical protein